MAANSCLIRPERCQLPKAILLIALMVNAAPALAQHSVHVETTVTNITDSNFTYGPASATCDPVKSGPGCKFVSFDFKGTCATAAEGPRADVSSCTITGMPTIWFSFSPSGARDENGNSTGVCAPFIESLVT